MLLGDSFVVLRQSLIANLAGRHRLPSISSGTNFAKSGGLMDYRPINMTAQFQQAATYVDLVLKGSKPADLPVQAPTQYGLAINLKTAKALGLTIPETLLATADEVIQ
jgi:putative ABC transport system substrate-binding protein